MVGDLRKLELLRNVPARLPRPARRPPQVPHRRAHSIRVETAEPARVQFDGEVVGSAPVTFSVVPGALWLAG